ncbi:DNA-binding protein YbiB [Roseateles saccharophilus]|uniref:Anthranilate phosphoribosyltransferase n=1 Tax=Roseateles saccharophilus TaxID=304 RepID=A0A4R3VDX2_ROSSA|nr:DNA-binding protein YbiB [Roseateles saccharophilus]MDG0832144.1 DNA-binding protein YbiB [Roseateles saccharophilus]TCV03556.1 anthranilate phosphoribosyltransferase [Roseateles saccharophilus]
MDYATLIKEVGRGARGARDLRREQAEQLFGAMLDGQVPDLELGALLIALRVKGESADEVAGFLAAMQARTAAMAAPEGPRTVLLPSFNGARKQANLMPLVAQLLAREGVPVLVFGRHDFDSRVSPFELLDALGLRASPTLAGAEQQLTTRRLAVLPLQMLNPGLNALMALRPRLGVRNSAHSLAKLLDPFPAGRGVRVVAVTHPEYLDSMAAALPGLTAQGGRALLMRASEGEAYAHLRRKAHLIGFQDGRAAPLHAADTADLDWPLSPACTPDENAALIRAMLDGREAIPPRIVEQVTVLRLLATN